MATTYRPVVIIGAPRSGTNMLRDTLVKLARFGTWPCDEINYIWRHGNVRYPSDAFPRDLASERVQRYIRTRFDQVARRSELAFVVEKTCANSLRVGFVDAVLPEAKYIFIVRDGVDAVASTIKRWKAGLDLPYLMRKARFVPASDLPYYAFRYCGNRIHRWFSSERRLASWGPRLDDMPRILSSHTLDELSAIQWRECVERAHAALAELGPERVHQVRYEAFVQDPTGQVEAIRRFLELPAGTDPRVDVARGISTRSVGKGRNELGEATLARILPLVASTMRRHGYN